MNRTLDAFRVTGCESADIFSKLPLDFWKKDDYWDMTRGDFPCLPREFERTSYDLLAAADLLFCFSTPRTSGSSATTAAFDSQPVYPKIEETSASAREPDPEFVLLEAAAEAGDEQVFLEAKRAIDWAKRPAGDFIKATRLALAAGAFMAARNLSAQGAALYPKDAELLKIARVLAPPKIKRTDLPARPDIRANQQWLDAHAAEYRGQWIAVRNGQFLGAAHSLQDLVARVGMTDGVLLTRAF